MPFDFASERVLIIARNNNGELIEERFRSDLKKIIVALIRDGDVG